MKKLADNIVNSRRLIVLVFVLALILSVIGLNYVQINSDMISYLPESSDTYTGMAVMRANFNMEGDAIVALGGIEEEQASYYAGYMKGLSGVREVIWRNYMQEQLSGLNNSALQLMKLIGIDPDAMQADLDEIFYPEEGVYLYMLQLSVSSSSTEAVKILTDIEEEVGKNNELEYASGGSTDISKGIMDTVMSEMGKYIAFAGLFIVLVLFLATSSYLEPIVLLLTLGISIVINLGSNFLFNNMGQGVSIYTFAASAVLQLGLTMDYAIFLMHAYNAEYAKIPDVRYAMRRAIPQTFVTILASAATTVGGFLALFAMRFTMGMDLGAVLAKGVLLSLISVLFLQPCIVLLMPKLLKKTTHKPIVPRFKRFSKFIVKYRFVILIIACVAVLPAMLLRYNVDLSYIQMDKNKGEPTQLEQYVDELSNSVVLIVPDEYELQDELIARIKAVGNKEGIGEIKVFGVYAMLPSNIVHGILSDTLPDIPNLRDFLAKSKDYLANYINNGYVMMSIMIANPSESNESYKALERIRDIAVDMFGEGKVHLTGVVQAVSDLKSVTPLDFSIVSFVSMAIIALILLLNFRSIKFSVIIILIIEIGIWINLAFSGMLNQQINFMGYIIISSVQLGATVDYAILYTAQYKKYCTTLKPKEAAQNAIMDTMRSIITSASIMSGACFAVTIVSTNLIISDITLLIARGALISGVLCLTVLPAALVVFSGFSFRKIKFDKLVLKRAKPAWRTVFAEEYEAREIAEAIASSEVLEEDDMALLSVDKLDIKKRHKKPEVIALPEPLEQDVAMPSVGKQDAKKRRKKSETITLPDLPVKETVPSDADKLDKKKRNKTKDNK